MLATNELVHNGRMTKVERYGWSVADAPGKFMMIPKNDLRIDHSYQRPATATDPKVKRIAAEWSWLACGAIIVGLRRGLPYVIDGQHRVLAAWKRADITELPCIVFETENIIDEASGFRRANKNRKPMQAVEEFNAMLVEGNREAQIVNELVSKSGRKISKGAGEGTVKCVSVMLKCIKQDEGAFRRIWPVVIEICEDRVLHSEILDGAFYLETNAADDASIAMKPWRDRFINATYSGMLEAIGTAKAFYSKGGPKVYAQGILSIMNKRARTNLFRLKDDAARTA